MSNIETALKNVIKHRNDYGIALVIISMAMAALIFLQLLVRDFKDGIYDAINRAGFNIIALNVADLSQRAEAAQFDYLAFHALKDSLAGKFNSAVCITPILMKKVILGISPDELFFNTTVVGVESDFFLLRPIDVIAGEILNAQQFEQGDSVMLISQALKDKIFGMDALSVLNQPLYMRIDDKITRFRVAGIVKQEQDRRYKKIFVNPIFTGAYVPLLYFKRESFFPLAFMSPKIYSVPISDVIVKAANVMNYNTLHDRLISYCTTIGMQFSESMYNYTNIKVQRLIDASEKLGNIFSMITVLTEIIVLTIMMVIVVRSRHPEITIRKIEGATNRKIAAMFFWEGIMVAWIGGAIGTGIGFFLNKMLFPIGDVAFSRHAMLLFLIGFLVSIFVGISATIIPAITAWRARPVDGLKKLFL